MPRCMCCLLEVLKTDCTTGWDGGVFVGHVAAMCFAQGVEAQLAELQETHQALMAKHEEAEVHCPCPVVVAVCYVLLSAHCSHKLCAACVLSGFRVSFHT